MKKFFFILIAAFFVIVPSGFLIHYGKKNRVVDLVLCWYKERLDWIDVLSEVHYLRHVYIMKYVDTPLVQAKIGKIDIIQEYSPNNVRREGFF